MNMPISRLARGAMAALALSLIAAGAVEAKPHYRPATSVSCDTYINSRGNAVCRPVRASKAPPGASAKCRDGTYSFSQSRRGTCSHHGGVAVWL